MLLPAMQRGLRELARWARGPGPTNGPGLYGVAPLSSPHAFESWRVRVEHECKALRALCNSRTARQRPRMLVELLDTISARLCLLLDTAEVCQSSHADEQARQRASSAYASLSEFVTKLNMDVALYQPLAEVVLDPARMAALGPEASKVAASLKLEFERDGIHLSAEDKLQVEQLQADVRALETRFMQLERRPAGEFNLSLGEGGQLLATGGLLRGGRVDPKAMPPSLVVPVNAASLSQVLRGAADGGLRRRFYVQAHGNGVDENLTALRELVRARRELAQALGFASFAHFSTSFRIARSPAEVHKMLVDLSARVRPQAERELQELQALKDAAEGPHAGPMQAWDVPYYSQKHLLRAHGRELSRLNAYFTLDNCLQGLQLICNELFGLTFEEAPLGPHERWAPDVTKLVVREASGELAGHLYLDLYQRPGKYPNAAHFQIQCSHRSRPLRYFLHGHQGGASVAAAAAATKLGLVGHSSFSDGGGPESNGGARYQLPSSVLLCNFERGLTLLHHSQVQTLFHEFGHALHSLLSRTEFQHLSGTRGELDFVETPSQLMEYFCLDERVLQRFAFHYQSGEPIPPRAVAALRAAKSSFQALEMQQQILFAACDQHLFGEGSSKLPEEVLEDRQATTAMLRDLHERFSSVPHVEGTFWIARFSHLVNYGAAYYGYTYARALAADLWHSCFEEDPLNRQVGAAYRSKILAFGGTGDPHEMLEDMLGRPTNLDALMREVRSAQEATEAAASATRPPIAGAAAAGATATRATATSATTTRS